MKTTLSLLGVLLVAIAPLSAQRTIIVDMNGGGDFTQIQPAVDLADPGDIVRIRHGRYGSARVTKGIRLLADPPGSLRPEFVLMGGSLDVQGLARDQTLVVAGIPASRISLQGCRGSVYLSHVRGTLAIRNCADVNLERCSGIGAARYAATIFDSNVLDVRGVYFGILGTGLRVERSNLTLVETQVKGGVITTGNPPASLVIDSHVVFTPGTQIRSGGMPPGPSYRLDGNNTAWRSLHSVLVNQGEDDDRLEVAFETDHTAPHLMLAFSLATRPSRLAGGIFYLDHDSVQLIHSAVSSNEQPRSKSILLPPEFSLDERWLGIPITFQALATDRNGKITLSAPYTMVF